ncbi:sulfur oxidation c-type cytochrome SoxX [Roseobacter ponti]|uniref:Sulfur oxidation c-type cytochrome SoxX n=1 Tax=Roseobacter ponti TaxID=1891787 RepID=A0A858SWG7_9RHOB|nr:sulfur oxidation c-type cytochrome SoxX [Roseobacter ponti]QJF52348.1 sulfur oxidation c-type cytochrome SoxX [Roseobacter ponti]
MKRTTGIVAIAALVVFPAMADEVAPSEVKFEEGVVSASLTGTAGDPVSGRDVFANRKLGNCLACHANSDLSEESFHGEVAPVLDGVADRWTEEQLRGIVSNAKMMFEGTMMPAFYIDSGYERPLEDFAGTSILTAQQVEDVVAYLKTLKE